MTLRYSFLHGTEIWNREELDTDVWGLLLRRNPQSVYSPLRVPYAVLAAKQSVQDPASR
jgi:hypothetical protein